MQATSVSRGSNITGRLVDDGSRSVHAVEPLVPTGTRKGVAMTFHAQRKRESSSVLGGDSVDESAFRKEDIAAGRSLCVRYDAERNLVTEVSRTPEFSRSVGPVTDPAIDSVP